ncbi:DMT family transporter [Caryophanon latum]|uniref:EamA domain-containing protein n=1 Tax=Caryophanon latum TaxID=33977 RepID=A0A1C0YVD5_9BACL|nr:DMT family transporter [Caryophanon latum]OCS91123.1 hypothetical protein A6K76_10285 [Caryophanon latum]
MTQQRANVLLVLVTFGWGASYLFTKFAVAELQPFNLVAIRFCIAFVVMYALCYSKIKQPSRQMLLASATLGILLCAVSAVFGYALQVTAASTASFLISTTVVFVPLLMMLITRKLPSRQVAIGLGITLIGISLFSIKGTMTLEFGMVLCLVTALLYAVHIVLNNYYVRKQLDGIALGVYQLGFGSAFAFVCMPFFETPTLPQSTLGWTSLFMLAIVCSAFAVVVQSAVQKYTSAVHTGFILSLEPIFAALLGFLFLQEVMTTQELVGAAFIFAGMLVANYVPKKESVVSQEPHLSSP